MDLPEDEPVDAETASALHELAARIRAHGSVQAADLGRAADSEVFADQPMDSGRDRLFGAVLRTALRVFGLILGSIRLLVVIAVVLAVANVALLMIPARNVSLWPVLALLLLAVALLPAFALNRVGKRFAAFRDSVTTLGHKLPDVLDIPQQLLQPMLAMADDVDTLADQGRIRRVITSAKLLLRFKQIFNDVAEQNRELVDSGTVVISYGPQDVLLATWGSLAIVGLALALPPFALVALITIL